MTTLNTVTDKAFDLGREVKESVEDLGHSAGRKLDEKRYETGEALHAAADSVRTTARRSTEAIDSLAAGAAGRLDAGGSYVEDHDLGDAVKGLQRFARRHLAGCLMAAGAVGFIAGCTLGRTTHSCGKAPEST